MPFCTNCGADAAGARFCPKCGAPMEAAAGSAPGPGGSAPPPGSAGTPGGTYPSAPSDGGLADNVAGALAYFTIIPAILFLVIDPFKTRRFVRFHSFQCLFLCAAAFVLFFALGIMTTVLGFLGIGIISLLQLGFFVIWLVVVIKAYQGQEFRLPVIGDLAAKQV